MPDPTESKLVAGSRVLVTGAAGFIGSHLCERLLVEGHEVIGIDCFTDFYALATKRRNLERAESSDRFQFHRLDLSVDPFDHLLEGVDAVFHLAAQAGVRGSFGEGFDHYVRHNIGATQRLLEASVRHPPLAFVYASSSSVYGNAPEFPTDETARRRPVSPYGVTKVSTEDLASVYHRSHGLPAVGLRYFTAYGPRQRPDMAFTRFIGNAIQGEPLTVFGDGTQIRDFTFVEDVVSATIAAARFGVPGSVYNIGGGNPVELNRAIEVIGELVERDVHLSRTGAGIGEAARTGSDTTKAAAELGFRPASSLEDGLQAQVEWLLELEREGVLGLKPT